MLTHERGKAEWVRRNMKKFPYAKHTNGLQGGDLKEGKISSS
jgi:hypothetical protein